MIGERGRGAEGQRGRGAEGQRGRGAEGQRGKGGGRGGGERIRVVTFAGQLDINAEFHQCWSV